MQRRPLTLIEIVIALGVLSLLLSVTFPYLRQTLYFKRHFEIERIRVFSKAHVQTRLAALLARVDPNAPFKTVQLKGGSTGLMFGFNNQKDFDRAFYGQVTACLFFDRGHLLLQIQGKGGEMRQEVLMEGLRDIQWIFSYATEGKSMETTCEWDRKELPLFLLLEMTLLDARKETLYFRLKSSRRLGYPV